MSVSSGELSEREQEILRLVATGASNKEIAQRLSISANTVKVHLRNIFAKVGAASRTEAAMYAVNVGLVPGNIEITDRGENLVASIPVGQELAIDTPGAVLYPQAGLEGIVLPLPQARKAVANRWLVVALTVLIIVIAGLSLRLLDVQPGQPAVTPSAEARWHSLAPMSIARYSLAVAVYENQIYAIAGNTGSELTGAVERYDPAEDSWVTLTSKPLAVSEVSAALIGGKIYIPGGLSAAGQVTNVLEIYDPRQDRWSSGAPLPVALSAYALASFEGRLYLFGGWDGSQYLASVFEYSPAGDLWQELPPMPTGRAYAGAAVLGREIYVYGGFDGEKALPVNEVFSPDLAQSQENPWITRVNMPQGVYAMNGTGIAEMVYVFGGLGSEGPVRAAFQYQPISDQWRTIDNPVSDWLAHFGLASSGLNLYIIGGLTDDQPTAQNLSYQAIYTVAIPIIR